MSCFFEKVKIDRPLAKLTKREKRQKLIKLDVKEDITTVTNEIQRIIRKYFLNVYSNN
jgi:hypothetical protein